MIRWAVAVLSHALRLERHIRPDPYVHSSIGGSRMTLCCRLETKDLTWGNIPSENRTHGHTGIGANFTTLVSRAKNANLQYFALLCSVRSSAH